MTFFRVVVVILCEERDMESGGEKREMSKSKILYKKRKRKKLLGE